MPSATSPPAPPATTPARVVDPWLPQTTRPDLDPGIARPTAAVQAPGVPGPGGDRLGRAWARRGVWLGLVALALGGAGEWLLFQEWGQPLGTAVLALALLLGVLAWPGTPLRAFGALQAGRPWPAIAWRPELVLRLAGIAGAAMLAAAAAAANMAPSNEIFGPQGWLWLASMALLLLSCARWYPPPGRAADPIRRAEPALEPAWSRAEMLLFAGLVVLALVTRLAWLDDIPWRFHFDEGYAFTETMRFYQGPMISLFTTTWQDTSLPSLWFAFAAGLMRFTGVNLGGVRLGEALIGALTVIPVYGIARLTWGRTAAALAAFALAISAVDIHYSRVSIINLTTAAWWAVCFYFLLRGLRSRRPGDFVWAGLAAGTSMYTFYGTRLLPYLLAAFVAYLVVFHFGAARERLGHFALLAVGFLAGFGPLLGYFLAHPEMWPSRALSKMNVPPVIPTTWDGWVQDWNVLAPLAWKNFLGLSVLPSNDTVYYAPFMLAPEALLVTLGLGLLIWRWREPAAMLLLLTGLGVVLAGGTLIQADSIPSFAHWTPAFPVFFLTLALPLCFLLRALRRTGHRAWLIGCILLAGGLVWDAGANLYGYLVDYPPKVAADHSLEAVQGRFLEHLGPDVVVHIVGPTWQPVYPDIDAMLAPRTAVRNLLNPSRALPLVGDFTHDQVFVFYNDQWPAVPAVEWLYPGGVEGALASPADPHVATSYRVPAAVARQAYGVQARFVPADRPQAQGWEGRVGQVGALPPGLTVAYPLTATWTGAVYVGARGPIEPRIDGAPGARMWIAGQPASSGVPLSLEPGWARLQVQAQLAAPSPLHFLLAQGGSPAQEVDTAHLWPAAPDQGLAVTIAGQPPAHRVDSFLAARTLGGDPAGDPVLPLASSLIGGNLIRWEGEVRTEAGAYTMLLRTDALAQLSIDGDLLLRHCTSQPDEADPRTTAPISLAAGWHAMQIDMQIGTGGPRGNGIEWRWIRPDGVEEVVPPGVLRLRAAPDHGPIPIWPAAPTPIPCAGP